MKDQAEKSNQLNEPEYVDEIFPEDTQRADPWSSEDSHAKPREADRTDLKAKQHNQGDMANNKAVNKPKYQGGKTRPLARPPLKSSSNLENRRPIPFPAKKSETVRHTQKKYHADTRPNRPVTDTKLQRSQIDSTMNENIPQESRETTILTTLTTTIPDWFRLEDVIKKYRPFPDGSLILGVDQGGLPLVVSLQDHSIGPMLLLGDQHESNRKHLKAILASAENLNPPEILQIDVISTSPESFQSKSSNLRRICNSNEDVIFDLLGAYLEAVEKRLNKNRQLPFTLLVLDQIDQLTARLAEESLRFLRWIMRRGPQVGIWPIATLTSGNLHTFDNKTYRAFGLRLYGKMVEKNTALKYTEISPDILKGLSPGNQGCFKLQEDVIEFSIPEVA